MCLNSSEPPKGQLSCGICSCVMATQAPIICLVACCVLVLVLAFHSRQQVLACFQLASGVLMLALAALVFVLFVASHNFHSHRFRCVHNAGGLAPARFCLCRACNISMFDC